VIMAPIRRFWPYPGASCWAAGAVATPVRLIGSGGAGGLATGQLGQVTTP
jgi:hypothetical protein